MESLSIHADAADAMAMTETAADAKADTAATAMTETAVADATNPLQIRNVAFAGIRVCDASRLL